MSAADSSQSEHIMYNKSTEKNPEGELPALAHASPHLKVISDKEELDVFLLRDDRQTLQDRTGDKGTFLLMSPFSFRTALFCPGTVVTPDLERLKPVGGSKSVLQLALVTPHTAGVELFPLKVVTA